MYGYKNRNEAQPCYVLLEAKCCCFHLVIMFVVLVWPIVRRSWRFSRSNTHIIFQLFCSLFVFIFHSKRFHRLVLTFVFMENEFTRKHRKLARPITQTNNNRSIGKLTRINILIPTLWNPFKQIKMRVFNTYKSNGRMDYFRLIPYAIWKYLNKYFIGVNEFLFSFLLWEFVEIYWQTDRIMRE